MNLDSVLDLQRLLTVLTKLSDTALPLSTPYGD